MIFTLLMIFLTGFTQLTKKKLFFNNPQTTLFYGIDVRVDPQGSQKLWKFSSTLSNFKLKDSTNSINEYYNVVMSDSTIIDTTLDDLKVIIVPTAGRESRGTQLLMRLKNQGKEIRKIYHIRSQYYPAYTRFYFEIDKSVVESFYNIDICTGTFGCSPQDSIKQDLSFKIDATAFGKRAVSDIEY
jgi:hypothetical protein